MNHTLHSTTGLLVSGGLDSSILMGRLLAGRDRVQPFYVRFGLAWQDAELSALAQFTVCLDDARLEPLVMLDMPVGDLYGDHWSVTGREAPGADTPDEAVFLPGRNLLLAVKAAIWCQLHGVDTLALAPLRSNPFPDVSADFFAHFEALLNRGPIGRVRIARPFAELSKRQVMELGRDYPLEHTFSCISPRGRMHCGACNKCAERQEAFRLIGRRDPTHYANGALAAHGPRSPS
jgi:7-cyano-7-deazaguanine synthase